MVARAVRGRSAVVRYIYIYIYIVDASIARRSIVCLSWVVLGRSKVPRMIAVRVGLASLKSLRYLPF